MRQVLVKNFNKGTINTIEDFSIPEEAASKSLNWLTRGDRIELSGGYSMIDPDNAKTGTGRVTGLQISSTVDGDTQAFCSYGTKVEYLDSSDEWQEVGTDILGSDADGEDIAFTEYVSLAGYQTWLSSPNSSLFKIMTANPGSYLDMYDAAKNHKGYIDAQNNRLHLWYKNKAKNYLYGSYKDLQNTTVYTSVTGEAIGALGSTAYSGTLAALGGKKTCFNAVFTDGTLTIQDDKDGGFVGDVDTGGTNTINYVTGAYSITFSGVTTGAVTANYDWEDSTVQGLADFTFSTPRVATEGYFLPQNTGGDLLNILPYGQNFYCIHENNAYLFFMPVDDVEPTNKVWRRKVGMDNWRAAIATGDGIYYIDTGDQSTPRFKLLTLGTNNDEVIPIVKSFNIDLRGFTFDKGEAVENGDYIIFTGRDGDDNDRVFAYNRLWDSFDTLKYYTSALANNDGVVWAGDSLTDNVYKIFSGYSADGALVENFWEGKLSQLGIDELKKTKRLSIEGEISSSQTIKVYVSYDRGDFVELGDIEGDGSYVDSASGVMVGTNQIGKDEIAGGGDGVTKYHYLREFRIQSKKFDQVKLRFVAQDVGFASISTIDWYDVKVYGKKNLLRYRKTL